MFSTSGASAGLASVAGGEPVTDGLERTQYGQAALADLYGRYARWLTSRLRARYGDAAEDLVQETWIRVAPYQARGAIRFPKALLLRIARNIAIDQSRQADAARLHAVQNPAVDYSAATQLGDLITKEAILSLPDDLRVVFVLNKVVGLTYEEVAARTGLSVKAVEWRLSRALIHCASQLRR